MVTSFNERIPELARSCGALLLDVAGLAEMVGLSRWHDPSAFNLYKLPFSMLALPLYADWVARLLGALRGKSRKCLVLDLDNTCWGGIVAEDGIAGIRIGGDSAEGESFSAVQRAALMLKERGIILAVSSKNEDFTARDPFRDHPDMLLKESDIAVFQANWTDKASNLEAIAETLSIGLDSLVLLDDNPAERAQVRAALPMVAVPELPDEPAYYAETLLAAGYFEAATFTEEDRCRATNYVGNARRLAVRARSRDLGDYLSSLDMCITHGPFTPSARARIVQLIGKSNQFNLTTPRYRNGDIAAMELDRTLFTLQTRLSDQFGDFGLIGVIIARPRSGEVGAWEIDTWLMSCRALGRMVEDAMLLQLVSSAVSGGIETIYGRYVPTERNGMVGDHFDRLGFERILAAPSGEREYRLRVADYRKTELPFQKVSRFLS
jgi:FkbH-like protein